MSLALRLWQLLLASLRFFVAVSDWVHFRRLVETAGFEQFWLHVVDGRQLVNVGHFDLVWDAFVVLRKLYCFAAGAGDGDGAIVDERRVVGLGTLEMRAGMVDGLRVQPARLRTRVEAGLLWVVDLLWRKDSIETYFVQFEWLLQSLRPRGHVEGEGQTVFFEEIGSENYRWDKREKREGELVFLSTKKMNTVINNDCLDEISKFSIVGN